MNQKVYRSRDAGYPSPIREQNSVSALPTIHELSSVSGDCVTADGSRSRTQTAVPHIKREMAWSGSILFHQRGSAFADFLELYFEATKLLRA
jgi:hypothetical protein